MRILFDENMNWRLRRFLSGHDIATVQSLGWGGIKNGELLRRAVQTNFEVLVTLDDNLSYQQDLSAYEIAVVVLHVQRNRLEDMIPLVPKLIETLPLAPRGRKTIVAR
jgi:predicted nuclease of predicted toxin-antitoxin system